MQTPENNVKDFGFYHKCNRKSLEYFNEKSYMVIFLLWKGHFTYNERNELKRAGESKGKDILVVDRKNRIDPEICRRKIDQIN